VLALDDAGLTHDARPSSRIRELVASDSILVDDSVQTITHDFARASYLGGIARYTDGQWWILIDQANQPKWLGLEYGDQLADSVEAWPSGWQTQNLAAGVLGAYPRDRVEGTSIVALPMWARSPHRIAWEGTALRSADATQVDDATDQLSVGGRRVRLYWRTGGRDAYAVAVGDPDNVVAQIPSERPLLSLIPTATGYYLTDGMGRYATLDAAFHRTDDWDIWDYLRSSSPDDPRVTLPAIWPETQYVYGLGLALYGLPGVLALIVLVAIRRTRPRAGLPMATISPAPRPEWGSVWTLALLGAYAASVGIALANVLPRLAT
jgi:hypothetical protein